MQLDVLKELGNIGAGNAVTALSKMLDKKINMEVPQVRILELAEVSEICGGAEVPVTGIYLRMEGDISGNIMFLLPMESSRVLLDMLMGVTGMETSSMTWICPRLRKKGNILAGSYTSSLAAFDRDEY